jgi:predicted amidohydrolase
MLYNTYHDHFIKLLQGSLISPAPHLSGFLNHVWLAKAGTVLGTYRKTHLGGDEVGWMGGHKKTSMTQAEALIATSSPGGIMFYSSLGILNILA